MSGLNFSGNQGIPTALEQAGLIDLADAALRRIAVSAGQTMSGELSKNISGAMYLAATAQSLAQSAGEIAKSSPKRQHNQNIPASQSTGFRAR